MYLCVDLLEVTYVFELLKDGERMRFEATCELFAVSGTLIVEADEIHNELDSSVEESECFEGIFTGILHALECRKRRLGVAEKRI